VQPEPKALMGEKFDDGRKFSELIPADDPFLGTFLRPFDSQLLTQRRRTCVLLAFSRSAHENHFFDQQSRA
jgi:hypothetical protein